MFMLLSGGEGDPANKGVTALGASVGRPQSIARDAATGDMWIKRVSGWTMYVNGAGAEQPVDAAPTTVEVKNSGGTITRTLTVTAGVATLAATDAIVSTGTSIILQNSSGTVSAGNAGLNSPAIATVAAGLVSAVKASA